MPDSRTLDEFISHLYRSAPRIPPNQYREWALEQLSRVIGFDAAFWGTGNEASINFHYVTQVGLDKHYAKRLKATMDINPIREAVINNLGKPVDMSEVIDDEEFYHSPLYHKLFRPYGIKRILASGHFDSSNGLYTLLSLYRFNREHVFTEQERELQQHLIFHLVSALSHAFFLHLRVGHELQQTLDQATSAICDRQGCFHEVQPRFAALLNEHFPKRGTTLPFPLPKLTAGENKTMEVGQLAVSLKPIGELIVVSLRPLGPLDQLSKREQEIVELICKGLSFKEVAKSLSLAPSTVSNHLYRVYDKLGISSRTELAQLVSGQNNGD
ncbi:helix-turn-helix transcriptional regulator [Thalassomonas viridans]|uniref:Helix-turn-helix transcriptional regulator n=1 Tax=Thalassomonas viridans TaxID=137584 RepID=A0AAF0C8R8_9GAMM|nr:helix-turn-helix transcriptional regulator [Thalassomonas viridans]WDE04470.1 helix-turn-helix transcriptional regulator [Thalassomonas viridans]